LISRPKLTTSKISMKVVKNMASFLSSPKACTDCTTPDRVR
jgi:hypothetical protein